MHKDSHLEEAWSPDLTFQHKNKRRTPPGLLCPGSDQSQMRYARKTAVVNIIPLTANAAPEQAGAADGVRKRPHSRDELPAMGDAPIHGCIFSEPSQEIGHFYAL